MTGRFIATKEHRRFVEFANAVRKQRTIGICFGPAGVGKTLSARRYAHWDTIQPLVHTWGPRDESDEKAWAAAHRTRTVLYTPPVLARPKQLRDELDLYIDRTGICIEHHMMTTGYTPPTSGRAAAWHKFVELLVVDEAERLNATALEILRDRHDRQNTAVIFIGMPGLDKQFSRYPQLYSRLGFAHQYRPLGHEELVFVLHRQWTRLGQKFNPDDFTNTQAAATIERITRGNFRLLERLFPQIERILRINDLHVITNDVIEAARSTLVIGTT